MAIELFDDQKKALASLKSGAILCGGVGSGKSITSIAYFYTKECGGTLPGKDDTEYPVLPNPKDLYIITTAKKRDDLEWQRELLPFLLCEDPEISQARVVVDSWNNIKKYKDATNAFFIFDEQRLVGYGSWVKAFLKISKTNHWILLSATPGDTWMDYIPVFIANGFYRNKTEFLARHVLYNRYSKYPKVDKYLDVPHLERLKKRITVTMDYKHTAAIHDEWKKTPFDKKAYSTVWDKHWDIYDNRPIKNNSKRCYLARKVVNSDPSRVAQVEELSGKYPKIIIFYNFNYELEILCQFAKRKAIPYSQWNGKKHEAIPESDSWLYFVQYSSGCEGWNCIETNAIVFFSQNYSYRMTTQAAGRIDRRDTPYLDLYYYHLFSDSGIDQGIKRAFDRKKTFNETNFYNGER